MIETERSERRIVRQVFGSGAHLVETGPAGEIPGFVAIVADGRPIGSGGTFRAAMADALTGSPPAPSDRCERQVT